MGVGKPLVLLPEWSIRGVACRVCERPSAMCPLGEGVAGELVAMVVGRWGRCQWVAG